MIEKRFELAINSNGQADIIDKVESKEKNAVCIYNDLGILPFSSAKAVCDLLNEQEEEIKSLKLENQCIQNKVMRLLDYVEKNESLGLITRNEIKKWWNGDAE